MQQGEERSVEISQPEHWLGSHSAAPCRCGEGRGVGGGQMGCGAAADLFLEGAPGCLAEVV